MRLALCAWVVLGLAACGGGGGGDDSGGAPSVSLSRTSVSFQAQQYGTIDAPSQTITATARNGDAYLILAGYSFASLNCPNNASCTITVSAPRIDPPPPPGTHNYSLLVRVCSDALCTNVTRTETVAITYTVSPGVQLTTTPGSVDLSADQGQTALQSLSLSFSNGAPTSVAATASYPPGNGTGWLTFTPSLTTLGVTAASLAPETYRATIELTYSGPGFSNTVDIPVTYTIRAAPSVEHVVPSVAVTNEARTVVIRGKGFDRMAHPVRFGGIDAPNVTTISATELRVTPPSFATAGVYTVDIPNDAGIATGIASFVVVEPQPYAAAEVDIASLPQISLTGRQVIYDAQRRSVYFNRGVPARARFTGGAWSAEPLPGAENFGRMSLSTDGNRLYLVSGSGNGRTASEYDLNQDAVVRTYSDIATIAGPVDEIVVLNDGQGLTHRQGYARLTNFGLGRVTDITFGSLYTRFSVTSPDLGKVLLFQNVADREVVVFDAGQRVFTRIEAAASIDAYRVAINRHGTRIVAFANVYDGNFQLLGSLTGLVAMSSVTLSPDGTRAYSVASQTLPVRATTLQVFDIGAASGPYPQVGATITLPNYTGSGPDIGITPDGLTLFIVGSDRFVVMPTP